MDQEIPLPAGNGSFSVTPVAVPVPAAALLLAVMPKPILLPANTEAASAVLLNARAGHCTVMVALAVILGALVAESVAVLGYVPQLLPFVPLVICTDALVPGAISPKAQLSTCDPTAPLIAHVPGPVYAGLIDQETPGPAGSGSRNVTPVAVPANSIWWLLAVMVKPIVLPAVTVAASAVLLRVSRGGFGPGGGNVGGIGVAVGVDVGVFVGVL